MVRPCKEERSDREEAEVTGGIRLTLAIASSLVAAGATAHHCASELRPESRSELRREDLAWPGVTERSQDGSMVMMGVRPTPYARAAVEWRPCSHIRGVDAPVDCSRWRQDGLRLPQTTVGCRVIVGFRLACSDLDSRCPGRKPTDTRSVRMWRSLVRARATCHSLDPIPGLAATGPRRYAP